jgi:hypothetical protein
LGDDRGWNTSGSGFCNVDDESLFASTTFGFDFDFDFRLGCTFRTGGSGMGMVEYISKYITQETTVIEVLIRVVKQNKTKYFTRPVVVVQRPPPCMSHDELPLKVPMRTRTNAEDFHRSWCRNRLDNGHDVISVLIKGEEKISKTYNHGKK